MHTRETYRRNFSQTDIQVTKESDAGGETEANGRIGAIGGGGGGGEAEYNIGLLDGMIMNCQLIGLCRMTDSDE
jgi:hypothetical protein